VAGLVGSKPASEEVSKINREEDIKTIQRALESKIVQEKLKAYGLSKEEIEKKAFGDGRPANTHLSQGIGEGAGRWGWAWGGGQQLPFSVQKCKILA